MGEELSKAGKFIKKNLRSLTMFLVIAVAAIFLVIMLVNRRTESRQGEWRDLYLLTNFPQGEAAEVRADLRALAEETSQDALAALAFVRLGEMAATEMVSGRYTLPQAKLTALESESKAAFATVLQRFGDDPRIAAKAHLGLGRLAECTGNLQAARDSYDAAAALDAQGAHLAASVALQRKAALDSLPGEVAMPDRPEPPASQPADDGDAPAEDAADEAPAEAASDTPAETPAEQPAEAPAE